MGKLIRIKYPNSVHFISRVEFINKQEFIDNFSTYESKDSWEKTSSDPYGMGTDSLHFATLGTTLQIIDVDTEEILFEKDFGNLFENVGSADNNGPLIDICEYFEDIDSENTVYRFAQVEEWGCYTEIYIPDGEEFDIRKLVLPAVGIWGDKAEFLLEAPTYNSDKEGFITAGDFITADDFANEAEWNYYVPGITTEYTLNSVFLKDKISVR